MSDSQVAPAGPSPHSLMAAISAIQQKRLELLESDPDLHEDEGELLALLYAEPDQANAKSVIERLARAAIAVKAVQQLADAEHKRLKARAERYERRYVALRYLVGEVLAAIGEKKLVAFDFTASLRPLDPELHIDLAALPDEYVTTETLKRANTALIREHLGIGLVIAGAALGAPRTSLSLRTK